MAQNNEMLPSSPDPLALSNENVLFASPVKARSAKASGPVITPRKPLFNASGNSRVQDFLISTPPAPRNRGTPAKSPANAAPASPWRIRLTVEAEEVKMEGCRIRRNSSPTSSPTKRLAERTTTTTVPLKGGDDTPPAAAKRRRGRSKKSLDSPRRRNGTPKPKASGGRNIMADTQENRSSGRATPTPPKKALGRPRKSVRARSNAPQFATDSLLLTPLTEKVGSTVVGGKIIRTRSRGRRQEITPLRLPVDPDNGFDHGSPRIGGEVPHVPRQTVDKGVEDSLLRPAAPCQTHQPVLRESGSPSHQPSPKISASKKHDEDMWCSKIPSLRASHEADYQESEKAEDIDPTNEHYDYDTILESEGFSMVSVDSLESVGLQSNESVKQHSASSHCDHTPAIAPSPPEPLAVLNTNLQLLPRHADESREGTPKLVRVVRAGIALQGVLSPKDERQAAGSPYGESRKVSPITRNERATTRRESPSPSPLCKATSTKQRLNDIFGGFCAGTRNELRAGLRLGEELAKRQRRIAPELNLGSGADEDVFHANEQIQYPQLPVSQRQTGYNLTVPGSNERPAGDVYYPELSGNQLPTPERSEGDVEEDRMSWKVGIPSKAEETVEATAPDLTTASEERLDESSIDYTMMAREAEWQREREAISWQIDNASKSQVIVIDSDEEGEAKTEHQEDEEDGDSDIWQVEAHFLERSPDATPESSGVMLQSGIMKSRRSKLPSPWRRNSNVTYGNERESAEADLSRQMDHRQVKAQPELHDSEKESLIDTSYSTRSYDSTSAPIACQLSPVKESDHKIEYTEARSLEATNAFNQPDDSTGTLITRQLSPTKGPSLTVTASKTATLWTLSDTATKQVKAVCSEITSDIEAEIDSAPATPQNRYIGELNESLEGDRTITSMDDPSIDQSLSRSWIGGNDTASIDPHLLQQKGQAQKTKMKREYAPCPSVTIKATIPAQSSWIARLTAPIWSVLTPSPALPPPATKTDILCSSPYEPLCQFTPWESCHMRALGPLYISSLLYGAHIFPFNAKGPAAAYHGITVTTSLGWSRTITKRDCSVADAFMILLEERGFALAEPGEQWIEEGLVLRMCISIWVGMVMRGEIEVDVPSGERVGLRKEGDRLWTRDDIKWKDNASEYFERKRREFDGLPSWKAAVIKWPPV